MRQATDAHGLAVRRGIARFPPALYMLASSHACPQLNNMPIKRFAEWLVRRGELEAYMKLLVDAFNPATGTSLMCR
jgi:hypothetical protein